MTDEHHIRLPDPDADHTLRVGSQPPTLHSEYSGPPLVTFHGQDHRLIVSINIDTAELTIHDDAHKADVPRIFWESIMLYGKTVVDQRDEAIDLLGRLYHAVDIDNPAAEELLTACDDLFTRIDKEQSQ